MNENNQHIEGKVVVITINEIPFRPTRQEL